MSKIANFWVLLYLKTSQNILPPPEFHKAVFFHKITLRSNMLSPKMFWAYKKTKTDYALT